MSKVVRLTAAPTLGQMRVPARECQMPDGPQINREPEWRAVSGPAVTLFRGRHFTTDGRHNEKRTRICDQVTDTCSFIVVSFVCSKMPKSGEKTSSCENSHERVKLSLMASSTSGGKIETDSFQFGVRPGRGVRVRLS